MNRRQLPGDLKLAICRQVATGQWTLDDAAELSTFGRQTISRWLAVYAAKGDEAFDRQKRQGRAQAKPIPASVEQMLDEALERSPRMRTRALVGYVRRHYGVKVSRRKVACYLRERGLSDPPVVGGERPVRRFEAPAPLDLIQVDILYAPRLGGGWFYVVNVLDDHSRMLLGSAALEEQTGQNVLWALQRVVAEWGRPARVLTDRGTQFAHWRGRTAFRRYVEDELKAEHVLAAAKHPQTLGKLERFHRTLREEGLDPKGYPSLEQLQAGLDRYRLYYNHERSHQALDGAVPADRFYGMAQPLSQVWRNLTGWGPQQSVFLTMNVQGRRLVLAGPRVDQLQVLWDDQLRQARPPADS
jgi:transposase InsO family protein